MDRRAPHSPIVRMYVYRGNCTEGFVVVHRVLLLLSVGVRLQLYTNATRTRKIQKGSVVCCLTLTFKTRKAEHFPREEGSVPVSPWHPVSTSSRRLRHHPILVAGDVRVLSMFAVSITKKRRR